MVDPSSPSPDIVSQLLDRCELTHLSEIYERWVDAREGAVMVDELQAFNKMFTLEKVREDVTRHPVLLLAHPPRPASIKMPSGDKWYVVDHRGLKLWIKRIFAIKANLVGQQVHPNTCPEGLLSSGDRNGIGLVIPLTEIQEYLGVSDDQVEKLDLLLERASTLPGIFLRRTQASCINNDAVVPAALIYYQQVSRFDIPTKRHLLYQLVVIVIIFILSLFFLLPFLRNF